MSPEDPAGVRRRRSPGAHRCGGRRGKYLLVELDVGDTLAVHLRMTGRLHWRPPGAEGEERFLRARFTSTTAARSPSATCAASGGPGSSRGPGVRAGGLLAARVGIEPLSPRFTAPGARGPARGAAGADQGGAAEPGAGGRSREHVRGRGALPGPDPPGAAGGLARRRRDPPPAPRHPRSPGARPWRRAARPSTATATRSGSGARCRTCCASTCTWRPLPALRRHHPSRRASPSAAPTGAPTASRSPRPW